MEVLFVVSPFNKREIDENRFVIFFNYFLFWFQGVVGPLAKLGTIEKVRKTTYIVRRDPGGGPSTGWSPGDEASSTQRYVSYTTTTTFELYKNYFFIMKLSSCNSPLKFEIIFLVFLEIFFSNFRKFLFGLGQVGNIIKVVTS